MTERAIPCTFFRKPVPTFLLSAPPQPLAGMRWLRFLVVMAGVPCPGMMHGTLSVCLDWHAPAGAPRCPFRSAWAGRSTQPHAPAIAPRCPFRSAWAGRSTQPHALAIAPRCIGHRGALRWQVRRHALAGHVAFLPVAGHSPLSSRAYIIYNENGPPVPLHLPS